MAIDPICGMQVNEKTGLQIKHQGKNIYFCSEHCLKKYQKENKLTAETVCTTCNANSSTSIFKNKLFLISLAIIITYLSSYFLPFLGKLQTIMYLYGQKIFIPVLIGLFLGGVIDWLVPREYISKLLAGNSTKTIFTAVLTGFLMSACSHGILALSIQLYKKGASPAAVVAFLLASPWANLPVTILMFGFFGWKAFLIIGTAVIIALIAGHLYLLLAKLKLIEVNLNTVAITEGFSIRADIRQRWRKARFSLTSIKNSVTSIWQGAVALANMVLWWILLGLFLSSLAGAFIPETFMKAYMGASALGLLVTLLVATVMEVCSEGTAPMAFEIYRQTGALGNAFVFLMAGVVTDYTEIGLLWSNIGKKTAIWLPIITVPLVIGFGIIFNLFF